MLPIFLLLKFSSKDLAMHRRLFLLMSFVVTHSLHAMNHWLQPAQIGVREGEYTTTTVGMKDELSMAQHFLDKDFTRIVAKPSIGQVHSNLLTVPYKVLDAVQKCSDENTAFAVNFASMPDDMRDHIEEDMFGKNEKFVGNKNAIQVFNSGPYGQSMLNCAYAMEAVRKNRMTWLSEGEQLGISIASPDLRRLCVKLSAPDVVNKFPKLTLYEEYLIANEMPRSVAKKLSPYYVACQLPYKERLLPALKAGMNTGAFWAANTLFGASIPMTLVRRVPAIKSFITHYATPNALYYTGNLPSLMLPVAFTVELLGGSAGFIYGTTSSLYDATKQYPLQKTIGSIAQQSKK
jgi:hypothetical protein